MKIRHSHLIIAFQIFSTLCLLVHAKAELEEEEEEPHDERKAETVTVETKLGILRGVKVTVSTNFAYYAFKGIKYAKRPARFEVSQWFHFCKTS